MSMQKTLTNLQNEVKGLKSNKQARPEFQNNSRQSLGSRDYKCYSCGKSGHMRLNCPQGLGFRIVPVAQSLEQKHLARVRIWAGIRHIKHQLR